MDAREINRYLELVERRLFILTHSGIDWKPEYEAELEAVDKEIAELRKLVDQEHERRQRMDIIKAVESFQYYHHITGGSREEWAAWRVQACEEWMLDESILEKGEAEDGKTDCDGKGRDGSPAGIGIESLQHYQAAERRTESPGLHSNPR